MKRIISMAICLIMILSLIQLPSFAVDTGYYEDTDGSIVITSDEGWDAYINSKALSQTASNVLSDTVYLYDDITISAKAQTVKTVSGKIIGKKGGEEGAPVTVRLGCNYSLLTTIEDGAQVANLILDKADGFSGINGKFYGVLSNYVRDTDSTKLGNAVITNVVNNVNLNTTGATNPYVGGLIGYIRECGAKISNCTNNAAITCDSGDNQMIGGIVGSIYSSTNDTSTTIKNCINTGTITATGTNDFSAAGGIIGINRATHTLTIENCINTGSVTTASNSGVGGIVGGLGGTTIVEKCANKGSVTSSYNSSSVGGILGEAISNKTITSLTIDKCYNEGTVTALGYAGGISANITDNYPVTITNCYNKGTVNADYAAGIICNLGADSNSSIYKITNCYNVGSIPKVSQSYGIAGTIKGTASSNEYSNNYSLNSSADKNSVQFLGETIYEILLKENTEAGYEKVNNLGSAYISMQGSYPVLIDNLPVDENLSPISTYKVTLTNGANGTASKDAETLVKAGEKYTVTVEPVSGYQVASYSDTLEQISENSFATKVPVPSDMSVSIDYEEIPASEGITSEQDYLYDVYEDAEYGFNLLCFAKFIPADNVTAFGIQLLDENKNVIHEGDALSQNGHTNGQFGVRFYGAKLDDEATYYLRPYVQYGEDEPIYADYITYTK